MKDMARFVALATTLLLIAGCADGQPTASTSAATSDKPPSSSMNSTASASISSASTTDEVPASEPSTSDRTSSSSAPAPVESPSPKLTTKGQGEFLVTEWGQPLNFVVYFDNTGIAEYTATGMQAMCNDKPYAGIYHQDIEDRPSTDSPEWIALAPHEGFKLCVAEIEMKNVGAITSPYYYPGDAYGYDGKTYPAISDGFGFNSPGWKIFVDSNDGAEPKMHLAPGESEMIYYVTEVPTTTDLYGIEFPGDNGLGEVPFDLLRVKLTM